LTIGDGDDVGDDIGNGVGAPGRHKATATPYL
jgi:hypothetical protein